MYDKDSTPNRANSNEIRLIQELLFVTTDEKLRIQLKERMNLLQGTNGDTEPAAREPVTGQEATEENNPCTGQEPANEYDYPTAPASSTGFTKFLLFGIAAIALLAVIVVVSSSKETPKTEASTEALAQTIETPAEEEVVEAQIQETNEEEEVAPEPELKRWDVQEEVDEMDDSRSVWKSLRSDDYQSFDFPYQGYTYANITVRYMKRYGTDVIFSIDRGQLNGNEYNGNDYLNIRFDDEKAERYYFNESDDRSSEIVFLRNPSKFIKKAKKAKRILIQTSVYQEGSPTWHFSCDEPLEWE